MKTRTRRYILLLIGLLLGLSTARALAQGKSFNVIYEGGMHRKEGAIHQAFAIPWYTFISAGTGSIPLQSQSFRMDASVGQPSPAGSASSDNFSVDAGYQAAGITAEPLVTHTLTVHTEGEGYVTWVPTGTVLLPQQSATFISGTRVTLNAHHAAGWYFIKWSGDWDGLVNPTTITMDADKVITATFSQTLPSEPHIYLPLICRN